MDEINITSAKYMVDNSAIQATIDGVEVCVPISEGNRHFIAIQKAVENGQLTIADAEAQ
jgi:hypothetical protein